MYCAKGKYALVFLVGIKAKLVSEHVSFTHNFYPDRGQGEIFIFLISTDKKYSRVLPLQLAVSKTLFSYFSSEFYSYFYGPGYISTNCDHYLDKKLTTSCEIIPLLNTPLLKTDVF